MAEIVTRSGHPEAQKAPSIFTPKLEALIESAPQVARLGFPQHNPEREPRWNLYRLDK